MAWRDTYKGGRSMSFRSLYDYWFKWLLNKAVSSIMLDGGDDVPTVNKEYVKRELILAGHITFTDVMPNGNGKLYGVACTLGGIPDECYIPVKVIVANPVLGGKTLFWRDWKDNRQDCVLVTNTVTDKCMLGLMDGGLFKLIDQTAVLLTDNLISINCAQKNCRPVAILTAEEETEAQAAEMVMQSIYEGQTYKVVRSGMEEKIGVNPLANTSVAQTISQLMELQTYIIANYLQQLGISANNIMKKERMITGEIDSQDNLTALSITEMLESWQRGFNEVNERYGTDFSISLNPAIAQELIDAVTPDDGAGQTNAVPAEDNQPEAAETPEDAAEKQQDDDADAGGLDAQIVEPDESITEQMQEADDAVRDIAQHLAGGEEDAEDAEDAAESL